MTTSHVQCKQNKGKQGSWFQTPTGFKQGVVTALFFLNIFLDSNRKYIEAKASKLGFNLAHNADSHSTKY